MSSTPHRARQAFFSDGLRAGVPAALLSGLPSTIHALLLGRDPLEASAAAGSILLPGEQRRGRLLLAAVPAHLLLSAVWAVGIAFLLPRRRPLVEGTFAGLAIAAFDLGVVGCRFPRIRALRPVPQIADHVAFGIIVAAALARPGDSRPSTRSQITT
jgi:hypothetical protein